MGEGCTSNLNTSAARRDDIIIRNYCDYPFRPGKTLPLGTVVGRRLRDARVCFSHSAPCRPTSTARWFAARVHASSPSFCLFSGGGGSTHYDARITPRLDTVIKLVLCCLKISPLPKARTPVQHTRDTHAHTRLQLHIHIHTHTCARLGAAIFKLKAS